MVPYTLSAFAFSGRHLQANFLIPCPVTTFCRNVTNPGKQIPCNWGCYTLGENELPVQTSSLMHALRAFYLFLNLSAKF